MQFPNQQSKPGQVGRSSLRSYRFLVLLLAGLILPGSVFLSCETRLSREQKQIDQWMDQAARFLQQKYLFRWILLTEGRQTHLTEFYQEYAELFSLPRVRFVDRVSQQTSGKKRIRELQYFKIFLLRQMLARSRAPFRDRLWELLLHKQLPAANGPLRLVDLPYELAREPDRALWNAGVRKARAASAILDSLQKRKQQFLQQTGFASEADWFSFSYQLGAGSVTALAEEALSNTDSLFLQLLQDWEERWNGQVPRSAVYFWQWRSRLPDWPAAHRQNPLPAMQELAALFGETLPIARRFTLHQSREPGKLPLAACLPINVPSDIRLTQKPLSGGWDWMTFSFLLGEGEYFANTLVKEWSFRQAGNPVIVSALGTLWQLVWEDSTWAARWVLAETDTALWPARWEAFELSLDLYRLLSLRLSAAWVLAQLQEGETPAEFPLQVWQSRLSRALGFPLSREETRLFYLLLAEEIPGAESFLGQVLAYMLREKLESDFGRPWFRQPAAIRLMKTIWRRGMDWPIPALLSQLNKTHLEIQPLFHAVTAPVRASE